LQSVTEEELRRCIYGDKPLTDLILSNLNLAENPILKPFIQSMIRSQWELVEDLLTDPQQIYDMIVEDNPELKSLLDTPEGKEWLNDACERSYHKLYDYAWE
ncbi:MAG: hypothetical protein ABEJ66_00350, partial [Candidatus Nanohaloarchaea archaeon]